MVRRIALRPAVLLLALSCFQGRTQDQAADALLAHDADGLQLTPGNLPSSGFRARIEGLSDVAVRLHHAFAWERYRAAVYDGDGEPLLPERARSVHPPYARGAPLVPRGAPEADAAAWLPRARAHDLLLETMYPGYVLGCGADLDLAMDLGMRLAVDVSHVHIQETAGAVSAATIRRLLDYERVEEIHVSHNDGRRDQHAGLLATSPHLAWVRERLPHLPVVLESLWHRASLDDQRRQLDLLRA